MPSSGNYILTSKDSTFTQKAREPFVTDLSLDRYIDTDCSKQYIDNRPPTIIVGFLNGEALVAITPKKDAQTKASSSKLKKEVTLPAKGKLAKRVKTPGFIRAIGNYFVGSWQELRQVRWPTRRATWSLTLAVLLFTAIMAALILVLDFGFEQLFKRIIL